MGGDFDPITILIGACWVVGGVWMLRQRIRLERESAREVNWVSERPSRLVLAAAWFTILAGLAMVLIEVDSADRVELVMVVVVVAFLAAIAALMLLRPRLLAHLVKSDPADEPGDRRD